MNDTVMMKSLADVCDILDSQRIPVTARDRVKGCYPYYGANGIQDYVDKYIFDDELVLLAEDGGNFGSKESPIAYRVSGKCWVNNHAHVLKPHDNTDVDYLCYALMFYNTEGLVNGATRQKLTQSAMKKMIIPLCDLKRQQEIVNELNAVSHLISLRQRQAEKLDELVKARFVEMFGDPVLNTRRLPSVSGTSLFKLSNGKAVPVEKRFDSGIPAYGGNGISWYTDEALINTDTLVVGRVGFQSGNVHFVYGPLWITDNAMYVTWYRKELICLRFLNQLMKRVDFSRYQDAGDLKKITQKPFMKFEYILPSMNLQMEFVNFMDSVNCEKERIQRSAALLETLKRSLMQQYFG